ncbi:MAG TPA: 23S rRNA (uracil(1939)-C(5))-methyltransferase RlmD [Candidatus Kapabacteria bacterium]|jgi:23S rRNA (uracil1939-C5)-methyltransferase|nr:23S rRNA (uracil(1939)-C(5))-methyltransferase RlmD [Candidatus Kapabacteria bacterium]HPP39344.1 23S rRNA (uracil(1939)-C(5))-methyltransferase RlmD [Candidatus Kapabacteria bacterium]
MKSSNEIEVEIESIGFEGISVTRLDGKAILLKGSALPGERVVAVITKDKKNFSEGFIKEIIIKSPNRIEPKCDFFGTCGGCSWQNLEYNEQLRWKKQHIEDAYTRIGKIETLNIEDVLPSNEIYEYRNKMEFSFGSHRWLTPKQINSGEEYIKNFALGMHYPGRYDKIIDIDRCFIQPEIGNQIIYAVRSKAINEGIPAYNYYKNTGFLKNIVLRFSSYQKAVMAILITNPVEKADEESFAKWFVNELPLDFDAIKTTYWAINDRQSSVATGIIQMSNNYDVLQEKILDVVFNISPFSFFQTNSVQLDKFIGKILEIANLSSEMTIWDLYCGCGSITLPAAKQVKKTFGFELNVSAVEDATHNAKINNISNVVFYQADLHSKSTPKLLNSLAKPDVVIVDPPRSGMNENLINHLLKIAPDRIIYVSCNPVTQARDIALLSDTYRVNFVQPVDMFPHTFHVEVITELIKK